MRCQKTRDLYPTVPGRIVLRCDRDAGHTGKHIDRTESAEWWGPADDVQNAFEPPEEAAS